VSRTVEALTAQDLDFQDALRRAWRQLQRPDVLGDLAQQVAQLERERDRAQERLRRAALMFVDGNLAHDSAQKDLEAADAELSRFRGVAPVAALPSLDEVLRELGGWASVLHGADIAAKRDVLATLIDRVVPIRGVMASTTCGSTGRRSAPGCEISSSERLSEVNSGASGAHHLVHLSTYANLTVVRRTLTMGQQLTRPNP
jgi:hypothetical protein